MRVQIEFCGEPFDRAAVVHTLRQLAMRVGWTLCEGGGERRIVYVTTDTPHALAVHSNDLVILSSSQVCAHLESARAPIPLTNRLPFVHPAQAEPRENFIDADVIAGAHAVMNLWYETQTREKFKDGWIRWREDWWSKFGFVEPTPIADEWLNEIARVAVQLGWMREIPRGNFLNAPFVIVLTHDVDYLPSARDFGLPRFMRALVRQVWLRKNFRDAARLLWNYARRWRANPFWTLNSIQAQERARGARSSFQFVTAPRHRFDPSYKIAQRKIADAIRNLEKDEWEASLHGSYASSRTPNQLAREKRELEQIAQVPVRGHRQHYLNFYPPQLFQEIERAGFAYDSSVGYNDALGARAGTCFPYRPYAFTQKRGYAFWEIPFVVMDTTLATTFRDSAADALRHAQQSLQAVITAGGCAGLLWHAEQSSGVLDPGYDQVYLQLLDWIHAQGGAMVNGGALLQELDARWQATWANET